MQNLTFFSIALMLIGCQPYQLRGKVVPGPAGSKSMVLVVDRHDQRFEQPGMGFTQIEATLDPQRLSRVKLEPVLGDWDGVFVIPIDQPGAGFLEYEVMIVARLAGYAPASGIVQLLGAGKRLLIVLVPGRDRPTKHKKDFLEETLEMGKPYLNH